MSLSALTDFGLLRPPLALDSAAFFFGDFLRLRALIAFFLTTDFFLAVALFDFIGLILVFFLWDGIAAVYHLRALNMTVERSDCIYPIDAMRQRER